MPRANRLDRLSFGFLQNPDFLFLAKPTLLHFVLPFFFAQNSTFATSSFWGSGHHHRGSATLRLKVRLTPDPGAFAVGAFLDAPTARLPLLAGPRDEYNHPIQRILTIDQKKF
jgi:hypothetical protein